MLRSLHQVEERCVSIVERHVPSLGIVIRQYQRLARYLTAGSIAAVVDLGLLYIFTDLFLIHYLTSAVFAFLATFLVSFTLQKFWTFQDHSVERVHAQAALYLVIALINLAVNTALMYAFVDWLQIWYIGAQFIASGLIACESFFISRHLIFKKGDAQTIR